MAKITLYFADEFGPYYLTQAEADKAARVLAEAGYTPRGWTEEVDASEFGPHETEHRKFDNYGYPMHGKLSDWGVT